MKKHLNTKHITASTHKMNIVKVNPLDMAGQKLNEPIPTVYETSNQSNDRCKFCLEFVEKSYMKEHILTLHSVKCPYCPKKFREAKYMNVHVSKIHPDNKDCKQCKYCKDMKKYGGPGKFQYTYKFKKTCEQRRCLTKDLSETQIESVEDQNMKDLSNKRPEIVNGLNQGKYSSSLVTEVDLKRHFSSTHQEAKNQYQCQLCPEKFVKKVEAFRHLKSKHAIKKHLNKHLNSENEGNKQSKTAIMEYLNKHLNAENEENKQSKTASSTLKSSKCSVCLKVFVNASELKSHFSRYHSSSQSFWKGNVLMSTTHFLVKQD